MSNVNQLNLNVTVAIRRVEEAQQKLAHAELAIAIATSPTSTEGRIARRGAISAARESRLDGWVEELLKRFLAEDGIDDKLRAELKALAQG